MSNPNLTLRPEVRARLKDNIKVWFLEERDEELGDLAATLILNFFLESIGPTVYNQGVYDAHVYMRERVEDLLELEKPEI